MTELKEKSSSYVIEGRQEVEIYAGQNGHVCIKQHGDLGEEPSLVLIHPDDIPALTKHLQEARKEAYEIRKQPPVE